jgi:hypothetical protein
LIAFVQLLSKTLNISVVSDFYPALACNLRGEKTPTTDQVIRPIQKHTSFTVTSVPLVSRSHRWMRPAIKELWLS